MLTNFLKKPVYLLSSSWFFLALFFIASSPVFAQTVGTINGNILGVPLQINDIIASLVQLAVAIAGLIFFAMLVLGGIKYALAGGDEKAVASARNTLTQAFIGLVIVVASFLIAQLIFSLFKVPGITIFNPNP